MVGVAARGGHDLPQAVGLLDQDLLGALGLGLHLGQDGVGLALGAAADLLGLGLGLQLPAALVNLGLDDDVGLLGGLLTLGAGGLGLLLGGVGLLQGLGCGDLLGGGGDAGGLGLLLAALGVGHGHLHLGGVLALDGGGVGLGHLDALVAAGLGLADGAVAVLLGHVLLCVVDGLGGGLLAQGVNVAGLVGDVGDVDVDEAQADLLELALHVAGDGLQELVAVGIDLLDVHGGDDQAELAEDDVLGQLLDLLELQAQQALGGVLHDPRLGGDAHGEAAGDVDADVLAGQSVFQIHRDGHGGQIQELIGLDDRPDKGRAAVDALGTAGGAVLVAAHLAVDDHNLVRGALLVALDQEQQQGEDDDDDDAGKDKSKDVWHKFLLILSLLIRMEWVPPAGRRGRPDR